MLDPNLIPAGFSLSEEDLAGLSPNVLRLLLHLLSENQRLAAEAVALREENAKLTRRIEHLEERLSRNSSNSDQPPSADPPFAKKAKRKGTQGRPGGKPGHPGHRRMLLPPMEVVELRPTRCSCGHNDFPVTFAYDIHQVVELPEVLVKVTHFLLHKGKCLRCGRIVKGRLPEEQRTGYGPRFTAMVAELAGGGGDSRRFTQSWCRSVLGVPVSLGAIQKMVNRTSAAIAPHHGAIGQITRASPVACIDETTWRQKGQIVWLWLLANEKGAFFLLHPKRSRKAFDAVRGEWDGTLVSDDYGVYTDWPGERQTCLAHLIREAKGIAEKKSKEVARFGKAAHAELGRLCSMEKDPPTLGEWRVFYARFVKLLLRGIDRKDEAGRFAARLLREVDSLWLFLERKDVPPTNNHAERCLRFPVIWRKRCFGTQTEVGNRWVERILSLRQTCRIKGVRPFPVLTEAIRAFFRGVPPDLSWITPAPMPQAA